MHEASLALNMIEICSAHLARSGCDRVDCIHLRIGAASGVEPDCLRFAFDAIKPGTPFEKAALVVEEVPVKGSCPACGKSIVSKEKEKYILSCPLCGASGVLVTEGRELFITEIDVS